MTEIQVKEYKESIITIGANVCVIFLLKLFINSYRKSIWGTQPYAKRFLRISQPYNAFMSKEQLT